MKEKVKNQLKKYRIFRLIKALYRKFYAVIDKNNREKWKKRRRIWQKRISLMKQGISNVIKNGYKVEDVGYALCLPKSRILYIDNPKVATTSIKEALLIVEGVDPKSINIDIHLYCKRYFYKLEKTNPYFCFGVVRNPFERVVSTYKNMYHKPKWAWSTFQYYMLGIFEKDKGFEYFVKKGPVSISDRWVNTHLLSQHIKFYDKEFNCYADYIARFENLSEDWKKIQAQFPHLPELPIRNQTKKDNWQDYYTVELAEIVYQRYQKDCEIFGYEAEYHKLLAYLKNSK